MSKDHAAAARAAFMAHFPVVASAPPPPAPGPNVVMFRIERLVGGYIVEKQEQASSCGIRIFHGDGPRRLVTSHHDLIDLLIEMVPGPLPDNAA